MGAKHHRQHNVTPKNLINGGGIRSQTYLIDYLQLEEALRENVEKYRILFHNANDAIYLYSLREDGSSSRFIEVNDVACRMLGYSKEELLAKSPLDIDAPECRDHIGYTFEELLEKKHLTFERLHVQKNGLKIPVEVSIHIFSYSGQKLVLSIARDITERKLMKKVEIEAFRQIERNVSQLCIINDQIRNPLAVIVALADMEGGATNEKILFQAKEINRIITQLDIGWLESEKIQEFLWKHYFASDVMKKELKKIFNPTDTWN